MNDVQNAENAENAENAGRRISEQVYENLPATLSDVAAEIDAGPERDSFLTGALPVVAGSLPNTRFKYGGHWQSLNLYTAVIAPASGGKGKMRHARKMGDELHERLRRESTQARKEWEQMKEDDNAGDPGPKPPSLRLFIEADNSAANLKHSLQDAPNGVIFETEFKTLSTVLNQDWGQFRDVLLKGFHNEPVEVGRVTEDPVYVGHPAPSIAVSGTPGTFTEVIGDTEDGLYSRFAFYQFEDTPEWKDQFGGIGESALDRAVGRAADTLNDAYEQLRHRDEPLYISYSDAAQRKLNEACSFVMRHWKGEGVKPEMYSSLKRAAVRALRIGALMHLLRLQESGHALGAPRSVEVSASDVVLGLDLSFTYLCHSLRIAAAFGAEDDRNELNREQRRFFDALPADDFTTKEAKGVADSTGTSKRTAQSWLKQWWKDTALLEKVQTGVWRKTTSTGTDDMVSGCIPCIVCIPCIRDAESPEIDTESVLDSGGTPPSLNGTSSLEDESDAPF